FPKSGRGRKTALAQCRSAARDFPPKIPAGLTFQYLDGSHRRHGDGHVLAWRRTIDRATGVGVQNGGGWTQGAGTERGPDFSAIPDLPAGRRDAVGLLPGTSVSN